MPSTGDIAIARFAGSLYGQPIINTFGFSLITSFGTWPEAALDLTTALDDALGILTGAGGLWMARRTDAYQLSAIDIIDVLPGVSAQYTTGSSAGGSTSEAGLPPNDALAITWRSAFKGPSGRGRSYLAGITELDQTNGFFSADIQTAADDIGVAMMEAFGEEGTANWRFAVIHRMSTAGPVIPPEIKPVMSYTVHNEVRTLGRRAMGRRIHRSVSP